MPLCVHKAKALWILLNPEGFLQKRDGHQATSHLCFFTLYRGMKGSRMGTVVTYF